MIILEKPYVSEFLIHTAEKNNFPVLKNETAIEIGIKNDLLVDENVFLSVYNAKMPLYTNSENSITWVLNNLQDFPIAGYIETVKNKFKFRELIKKIYPEFFFHEFNINEIEDLKIEDIKLPVIIKPSVGFLSLGVYRLTDYGNWPSLKETILSDINKNKDIFPETVYRPDKFLIEEYIDGEEFAVDAYFDNDGEAVILNIFKHFFIDDDDVSDRLYMSSKNIILDNLENMTSMLKKIGKESGIKQFPLHIEVRKTGDEIIPIEINPMRFAGFCLTDNAWFGYGINPYEYYFYNKKPDWENILKGKDGKVYTFIVLNMPSDISGKEIHDFDYDGLMGKFNKILEFRKLDFKKYPMFGVMFTESSEDSQELDYILKTNLKEFIK